MLQLLSVIMANVKAQSYSEVSSLYFQIPWPQSESQIWMLNASHKTNPNTILVELMQFITVFFNFVRKTCTIMDNEPTNHLSNCCASELIELLLAQHAKLHVA